MPVGSLLSDVFAGVEEPCLGGPNGTDAAERSRHGGWSFEM